MRDPLAGVPIRYKLTLGFVGLCLLAYGIGAALVSSSARDGLRRQIHARLRSEAETRAVRLDASVDKWLARAQDFASDGLIRTEVERLSALAAADRPEAARPLRGHLERNKLPLVAPVVTDLLLVDASGARVAQVGNAGPALEAFAARAVAREGSAVGGFAAPASPAGAVAFGIATPVRAVQSDRRIGWLVA